MLTLAYNLCRVSYIPHLRSSTIIQQLDPYQRCLINNGRTVITLRGTMARNYVQTPEPRPLPDDISSQSSSSSSSFDKDREILEQRHLLQTRPLNTELTMKRHQSNESGKDLSDGGPPPAVNMPYNIEWIFPRLRNPSRYWTITSQIVITAVGLFSKFVLILMNRTRVFNKERLVNLVARRPKDVPLVTVSNHHSCFDDPGLWGLLPVRYVCNTFRIRWSMAAHDICFTNRYHSTFFMYGKCIPVVRGVGVYQEAINLCIEKCALGHWVHVFPEGKVNMTKEEMRLKWGVGRIIYESPKIPIILPMWHEGMDDVLPNVEPYKLKWRKKVTVNIGKPLDLHDYVLNLKTNNVPEPTARKLITDKIQEAFRDLRKETEELHNRRN